MGTMWSQPSPFPCIHRRCRRRCCCFSKSFTPVVTDKNLRVLVTHVVHEERRGFYVRQQQKQEEREISYWHALVNEMRHGTGLETTALRRTRLQWLGNRHVHNTECITFPTPKANIDIVSRKWLGKAWNSCQESRGATHCQRTCKISRWHDEKTSERSQLTGHFTERALSPNALRTCSDSRRCPCSWKVSYM